MNNEEVFLFRDKASNLCVQGMLFAKGEIFYTIERPWLNNSQNVSCIPADKYKALFLPRSGSGKYRNVYHLQGVVGRSGVLTHSGNIVAHSKGCIIIGKRRGRLAGQAAVLNSRTALYEFVELMDHDSFKITVCGSQRLPIAA